MCVLNRGHSPHSDVELGLELPKRIASAVKGFDVNVILEGRGEGWDIETEDTVPHLTDRAGWERAVSITSGAGEVLVEDISASEEASEMNVVHDGAIDVPDTLDIEFLVVGGLDGIGISVGAVVELDKVLLAGNLIDYDRSVRLGGSRLVHLRDLRGNSGGGKGGDGELHY